MTENRNLSNENTKLGLTEEDMHHLLEESPDEKTKAPAFDPKAIMKMMGDDFFDVDAYFESADAKDFNLRMDAMKRGEDTPEAHEYWKNCDKGMKKELHQGDDPLERWASYLPLAALDSLNGKDDRTYPLIFVLHGAHNPILMTEGYGMLQLAAREELIAIVPQNENEEKLLSLLQYAKEHYPVDLSRIYLCGFSFGGCMTSRNAWLHPELFAGIGWGGMLFATEMPEHVLDGQYYPAFRITDAMLSKMEELQMPILLFMGENEMLELLPLWRDQQHIGPDHRIPLQGADKHAAFNNLRRAAGCRPLEFREKEAYEASLDPVVRHIGADFDRTQVVNDRGRDYYIGDSLNRDGECLFRTVGAGKLHHTPSRMWAEFIWEHISQYARDPQTGRLIRLGSGYRRIY